MWCNVRCLALAAVVASTAAAQSIQAQTVSNPPLATSDSSPLLTTSRTLQASLGRIWRGSPLWREAIASVRKTGRQVLVVEPADVMIAGRRGDRGALDHGVVAEAYPVVAEDSQIPVVVVVVNLRLVQETHDARLSVLRDFEADIDRILVHEVYGHAVPYLLAGDLSGRLRRSRTR